MSTPSQVFNRLKQDLFLYYNTPFGIRSPEIMAERNALLDAEGKTWQTPFIEVLRDYQMTGVGVTQALRDAGAADELGSFIKCGLIPFDDIFVHQKESLEFSIKGKNPTVTAGTGSGKTESFLLPIFNQLISESRSWTGSSPSGPRWWKNSGSWVPQREAETGRMPAVRALILYPMNALVEDQLVRLRRALDSDLARTWLDQNRSGHRFFFGRYTGRTPVSGYQPKIDETSSALKKLTKYMRETEERAVAANALAIKHSKDLEFVNPVPYIPRFDGSEMRSRWDMQTHAPDILITNYSMLNIMMLREKERSIINQTREWLHSNKENVFTLVVDELHMYRGTAGTEVSLLIKRLLHQLDLDADSPKVRFVSTSASLGENETESKNFLSNFYGARPDSFFITAGKLLEPIGRKNCDLSEFSKEVDKFAEKQPDQETAVEFLKKSSARDALQLASNGKTISLDKMAMEIFPNKDNNKTEAKNCLNGLMKVIASAALDKSFSELPRVRTHLFFKNIEGVWACANPDCSELEDKYKSPERTIGKLYGRNKHVCGCGSRVMSLLYCETCGEVFLGAHLAPELSPKEKFGENPNKHHHLVAELGDLDAVPDTVRTETSNRNYVMYWPRKEVLAGDISNVIGQSKPQWTKQNGVFTFVFRPVVVDHHLGSLRIVRSDAEKTGWIFEVQIGGKFGESDLEAHERISALPTICPNCGTDEEGSNKLALTDRNRMKSPIRGMRTGFEKVAQVLIDGLVRELRRESELARKVVLFSDSRQDAAKLSAGLEKRHYQDMIRQLIVEKLDDWNELPFTAALGFANGDRSDECKTAWKVIELNDLESFVLLRKVQDGEENAVQNFYDHLKIRPKGRYVSDIASSLSSRLLELGMNPGGTGLAVVKHETKGKKGQPAVKIRWTEIVDWKTNPSRPKMLTAVLQQKFGLDGKTLAGEIQFALNKEVMSNIFASGAGDLEELSLAKANFLIKEELMPEQLTSDQFKEIVRASVRLLGRTRRIPGYFYPSDQAPPKLRKYWELVEEKMQLDKGSLQPAVSYAWGETVAQHVVQPTGLMLEKVADLVWDCPNCRLRHHEQSGGFCLDCLSELSEDGVVKDESEKDYYAYLADLTSQGESAFRLHTEELSGQTDDEEAPKRQARFQRIFLNNEAELADEIDLLSVTTTMEAGVDIGSLKSVVMGNMPPLRFNYQQRVGRAGRRRDPFSFALTICRDRTHDDFYFVHPERITNDKPPAPYIDLTREKIVRRSITASVLTWVFVSIGETHSDVELGNSVHGEFGMTESWFPQNRSLFIAALPTFKAQIEALITKLCISVDDNQEGMKKSLIGWVDGTNGDSLVGSIDKAVNQPTTFEDLSQHLAEYGVLPMFGFPTRSRLLFHDRPSSVYPWPPKSTIDRNLDIAVSQFAPKSELVKDKLVHTAIGIASWSPAGGQVVPSSNPFGKVRRIINCARCSSVEEVVLGQEPIACPQCSAGEPDFSVFDLAEPEGFISSFKPVDFEGSFAYSSRGSSPKISSSFLNSKTVEFENAVAVSDECQLFVINQNNGSHFTFAKPQSKWSFGEHAWIDTRFHEDKDLQKLHDIPSLDLDSARTFALGMVKSTDALLFGPKVVPNGISITPYDPGRRGALYSLGFLIREVAHRDLDIGLDELTVGYSVRRVDNYERTDIFVADSLENGAGFATKLGLPSDFAALLHACKKFTDELEAVEHEACDSSCPNCIRDYSNLIYHSILDWRLGRDLLDLLMLGGFSTQYWKSIETNLSSSFVSNFKLESIDLHKDVSAIHVKAAKRILIVRHPLEDFQSDGELGNSILTERLDEAYVAAQEIENVDSIELISSFDLQRRPGWVFRKYGSL
jgi:ATP-dependent helicase YprA (DUF1998 family)